MEFDQDFTTNGLWSKDERIKFWVKRSRVKVMVGSDMPQNTLFGFAVITCWQKHNSQQSRNDHLVLVILCSFLCSFVYVSEIYCVAWYIKF